MLQARERVCRWYTRYPRKHFDVLESPCTVWVRPVIIFYLEILEQVGMERVVAHSLRSCVTTVDTDRGADKT